MKRILSILSTLVIPVMLFAGQPKYVASPDVLKSREEFRNMGFGIFIHWGIYSMLADGEWILHTKSLKHHEYMNLAGGFFPSKFDAREWVKNIKNSGAKYITITTRHHDGFSMFDTEFSDYDIIDSTPFKRDIIKEIADACHAEGIRLHFYYSQLDWGRDDYYPFGRTGKNTGRTNYGEWEDYLRFMSNQLTELLTNYGQIGAIWFDGMWDRDEQVGGLEPELWDLDHQYALIHKLQPSCLVGSNHHMTPFEGEDIQIFERDKPGENIAGLSGQAISPLPLETCQTMNHSWGYRMRDTEYKSTDELIRYLVETAGKNANLLLNIGPRPDGTFPPEAIERLNGIGEWMKTYAPTVQNVRGGIVEPRQWGVTTQRDNILYVHILDYQDKVLFIPYSGNKLQKANIFATDKSVKFTQNEEGIILYFDEMPNGVDYVIKLTFKNNI